jgi:hypothetical protein
MPEHTIDQNRLVMEQSLIRTLNSAYGPYAFGVVSLLLIWFTIVRPELQANKLDFDAFQKTLTTMQNISTQQEAISQTLTLNSKTLERMIDKMEL